MQLTAFADFGLRTLMYLAARPGRLSTVREIADAYGISRHHVVKVAHRLAALGYIESVKGKGGGLRLARAPGQLRLGELVRQIEPHMDIVECFNTAASTCRIAAACRLKHYLHGAAEAFIAALDRHTLAEAISDEALFFASLVPEKP